MDRSVRYEPCSCTDTGNRFGHALLETVTDRDQQGHRMISIRASPAPTPVHSQNTRGDRMKPE